MTRLTGLVPPIATPFRDGSLDLPSFARQIDYLAGHVDGYLVGGSVGEVASLTLEERATLMREAARCRPSGRSPRALDLGQLVSIPAPLGGRRPR